MVAPGCSSSEDDAAASAAATESGTDASTVGTATDPGTAGTSASTTAGEFDPSGCSRVIWVALDGVTLTEGSAYDAVAGTVGFARLAADYAPYPGDRAAVFGAIQAAFAPFDVCVSDARPTVGPYELLVVSETAPVGPTIRGFAEVDCGDANPSGIAFSFAATADVAPATVALEGIARLGSSLGLNDQLNAAGDYMYSTDRADPTRTWLDECVIFDVSDARCDANDDCEEGRQNSRVHLTRLLGPAAR
jgi:hypothetical protein